jgi:hypothetical protein
MAYNRDVTGLQSTLGMIERIKDPQQLQQLARQYQQQPNGGAIIAAALAQAQKLQRLKAGMQAQQTPQGQQGQQQEPPVVNEAIASINPRALPEDSGIARLPAGNMDFAEGGIVAFSGGGKSGYNEAGDEGRLQILAQEMRAAQQRLSQGDPRAQGDIDSLTREIGRIKKASPSLAQQITSALPMGSAQAAPAAAQAPTGDAPSIYSGPGFTPEGLEALGQRLDVIREARGKAKPPSLRDRNVDPDAAKRFEALQNLNLQSQREYEKYAAGLGLDKPAFAAPAAGGKSVGATTLPQVQSVAKEAAAQDIARQEVAGMESAPPMAQENFRKLEREPSAPIPPPELPISEKKMIGLAKEALPASERKGWTDDMLMQFFLSMMAGKSPNALANIGEAGLGALKYGQEAKKAEMEQRKSAQDIELGKAHTKYYGAAADRYALEDKPLSQYLKAVDNALAALSKDDMYMMAKPAEKAAMEKKTRERMLATYAQHYPELLSTMGAGGDEFKVLGSR